MSSRPSAPPRHRRRASVGAVFALVVTSLSGLAVVAAPAGPAAADDGSCQDGNGVTVVIDFQELGGGIYVRCAATAPRSGFEALQQAGIAYTTAARSPGFLCRIAGKPASDPCVNPSPADAYWGYWMAPRGGRWCYSNFGAGNRTSIPGTVEGWSFSKDKTAAATPPPGYLPGRLPGVAAPGIPANDCTVPTDGAPPTTAPPVTRPPATTPPTTPGGGPRPGGPTPAPGGGLGGVPGTPGAPGAPAPTGPGGAPGPSATTTTRPGATTTTVPGATTTTSTGSGPTTTGSSGPGGGSGETAGRAPGRGGTPAVNGGGVDLSDDGESSGSPVPLIVTGVLLAALGGAAFVAVRRNRAAPAAS